ncbi:hypothetical protein HDU76_001361, partial [Blyttiomyces sp. JEL0837]
MTTPSSPPSPSPSPPTSPSKHQRPPSITSTTSSTSSSIKQTIPSGGTSFLGIRSPILYQSSSLLGIPPTRLTTLPSSSSSSIVPLFMSSRMDLGYIGFGGGEAVVDVDERCSNSGDGDVDGVNDEVDDEERTGATTYLYNGNWRVAGNEAGQDERDNDRKSDANVKGGINNDDGFIVARSTIDGAVTKKDYEVGYNDGDDDDDATVAPSLISARQSDDRLPHDQQEPLQDSENKATIPTILVDQNHQTALSFPNSNVDERLFDNVKAYIVDVTGDHEDGEMDLEGGDEMDPLLGEHVDDDQGDRGLGH